jgi:hypothetical protein
VARAIHQSPTLTCEIGIEGLDAALQHSAYSAKAMKRPPPQETQWPDGAIFTVGHSTPPIERLVELLEAYGIQGLADIRTVPRSRHNRSSIRTRCNRL